MTCRLKQCRNIIKLTLGTIIQWNCNRNSYNFIQENAFGNVDKKTASALSRPQCVILFELFWCWKRDVSTNRWLAPFIARSSATTVLLRRISGRWLTRGTISTTCASWTLYSLHLRTHTLRKTRVDNRFDHYNDVIMGAMASQIIRLTIVYSTVYSGADQRKHQSFASLAFEPVTGEFPAQIASNAENVSIWWRHHDSQTPTWGWLLGRPYHTTQSPYYTILFVRLCETGYTRQ